jgi:hypothetical protein
MSGYDMKTMCEANGVDYNNPQETDWVKEVFGTSWATQHSVTFQDGNDKGHFFTSVNYLNNDGIVRGKKDTYTRLTGQLNADYQLYSWITAFNQVGIVPEEVYTGINYDSKLHNHSEMVEYMTAIAKEAVNMKKSSPQYEQLIYSLFDIYLGKVPEKFTYKGKEYTPKSFAESLGICTDDYVMLTSFTHKPYYEPFEIEIPDNWEHDRTNAQTFSKTFRGIFLSFISKLLRYFS